MIMRKPYHQLLAFLTIASLCNILPATAWLQSSLSIRQRRKWASPTIVSPLHSLQKQRTDGMCRMSSRDVVDVDFERVDLSKLKNKQVNNNTAVMSAGDEEDITSSSDGADSSPKTLLDMSLDLDPEWKETRIPFVDTTTEGENYIDAKLAFTVDLDGVTYGIAVPFDHAAAIVLEETDGSVVYLSPDDDENVELMEIMAKQLQEHVDEELNLKRTPRSLTITGDLTKYTAKWQDELLPKPFDAETLLDNSDESVDFFREFMKQELGEEEYAKTIQESSSMSSDDINEAMMELFNIPGLGENMDDLDGIEKMLKSMISEDEDDEESSEFAGDGVDSGNIIHDGVALKLISYMFSDGKAYSLVYMLKPFTLVGKYVADGPDIRFELLKAEEEKLVIPKIEELCRDDMERAGLKLAKR